MYLYARAALRPDREVLADIRRPQYEGLSELIGQPEHAPDFGPPLMHPTAGAVAVGARPFLIAYNINLESRDLELAKSIARGVRERSGGLPRVQALGLYLEDLRLRPGVDEPARLHDHADLEGVGRRCGEAAQAAGVAAARVGADRALPAGGAGRRSRPHRRRGHAGRRGTHHARRPAG